MRLRLALSTTCLSLGLVLPACGETSSDDGDTLLTAGTSLTTEGTGTDTMASGTEDGDATTTTDGGDGDGDTSTGDGDATGDGDGDTSGGDGDGDGDSSGDGDGDSSGDGDGDTSGDGDGDTSGDGDGDTGGDGDGDTSGDTSTTGDPCLECTMSIASQQSGGITVDDPMKVFATDLNIRISLKSQGQPVEISCRKRFVFDFTSNHPATVDIDCDRRMHVSGKSFVQDRNQF